MLIQLTRLLRAAAAAVRNHAQAVGRARSRRTVRTMLEFDERLLRDVGLTRADVVACLSSPADPVDFLEERRRGHRTVVLGSVGVLTAEPAAARTVPEDDRRRAA